VDVCSTFFDTSSSTKNILAHRLKQEFVDHGITARLDVVGDRTRTVSLWSAGPTSPPNSDMAAVDRSDIGQGPALLPDFWRKWSVVGIDQ
jgi:hypothetical protein